MGLNIDILQGVVVVVVVFYDCFTEKAILPVCQLIPLWKPHISVVPWNVMLRSHSVVPYRFKKSKFWRTEKSMSTKM